MVPLTTMIRLVVSVAQLSDSPALQSLPSPMVQPWSLVCPLPVVAL